MSDQLNENLQNSVQVEKLTKKEANKIQLRVLKAKRSTSKTKSYSKTRKIKLKGKYTLRVAQKKASKVAVKKTTAQELPVYIPRKIFRIVSLLRNEKFYQLVAKFFKPKVSTWKFPKQVNKKSTAGIKP